MALVGTDRMARNWVQAANYRIVAWLGKTFYIKGPLWGEIHIWHVDSPYNGPVMWRFHVYFVVSLKNCCTLSHITSDLRCLCDVITMMSNICSFHYAYIGYYIIIWHVLEKNNSRETLSSSYCKSHTYMVSVHITFCYLTVLKTLNLTIVLHSCFTGTGAKVFHHSTSEMTMKVMVQINYYQK